eukprot:364451-Chlamydomonas_euryale.AAC.8
MVERHRREAQQVGRVLRHGERRRLVALRRRGAACAQRAAGRRRRQCGVVGVRDDLQKRRVVRQPAGAGLREGRVWGSGVGCGSFLGGLEAYRHTGLQKRRVGPLGGEVAVRWEGQGESAKLVLGNGAPEL